MTPTIITPSRIPGPRPAPVLKDRLNYLRFANDPVGYVTALHRTYGPVAAMTADVPKMKVFAIGPVFNHQVLSDPELFRSPGFLRFPAAPDSALVRLNTALVAMNGQQHKQQRRLVQPAFHRRQVESYHRAMVDVTETLLEDWRGQQTLDIHHQMKRLALVMATRVLFGIDTRAEADRFGALTTRWLALLLNPLVSLASYDLPGLPYRELLRCSDELDQIYRTIIERKRAQGDPQQDMLAALIQTFDEDGGHLSDAELIGHANSIFIAGHDSSASTLTWALFLLAQHPQVYSDLLDELAGELHGATPSLEQLGRLPLLDYVVKETMRLLTPAAVIGRKTTAPCMLGGYDLPANTSVMLSPYLTHRDPDVFPEPQRFLPQRWSGLAPSTYQYLPFGVGPHMCLGSSFALLEMKLVLAAFVQRYRVTVVPNAQIDRRLLAFMLPRHGMPMRLAPQDRRFERVPVRGNIHEMVDLAA